MLITIMVMEVRLRLSIFNAVTDCVIIAQEIFYTDPSVLYVSIHAENDYPCRRNFCLLSFSTLYIWP